MEDEMLKQVQHDRILFSVYDLQIIDIRRQTSDISRKGRERIKHELRMCHPEFISGSISPSPLSSPIKGEEVKLGNIYI